MDEVCEGKPENLTWENTESTGNRSYQRPPGQVRVIFISR
jgi:hypothetical protein